ncbi:hypothetical protein SEVIR_9G284342v4 [Setaria viridis]
MRLFSSPLFRNLPAAVLRAAALGSSVAAAPQEPSLDNAGVQVTLRTSAGISRVQGRSIGAAAAVRRAMAAQLVGEEEAAAPVQIPPSGSSASSRGTCTPATTPAISIR